MCSEIRALRCRLQLLDDKCWSNRYLSEVKVKTDGNRVEPYEMERQDDRHPGVVGASQSARWCEEDEG